MTLSAYKLAGGSFFSKCQIAVISRLFCLNCHSLPFVPIAYRHPPSADGEFEEAEELQNNCSPGDSSWMRLAVRNRLARTMKSPRRTSFFWFQNFKLQHFIVSGSVFPVSGLKTLNFELWTLNPPPFRGTALCNMSVLSGVWPLIFWSGLIFCCAYLNRISLWPFQSLTFHPGFFNSLRPLQNHWQACFILFLLSFFG